MTTRLTVPPSAPAISCVKFSAPEDCGVPVSTALIVLCRCDIMLPKPVALALPASSGSASEATSVSFSSYDQTSKRTS